MAAWPLPDLAWLAAPVLALLAACLALVPLGAQVLARGVVFIDLAIAQVAACGALAAGMLIDHPGRATAGLAATLAALAGAAVVWRLAQAWPAQREALIGLVYVAAASLAVIGAAWEPHGRERLAALLAADVLWVPWSTTGWMALAALAVMAIARLWPQGLARDALFYPLFAITLSLAVPALGLYLVFALLIGPALWTRRRWPLPQACGLAALACAAGLAASWRWDLPSGASVAIALSATGLMAAWGMRRA